MMDTATTQQLQIARTAREAWDALPITLLDKAGRDADLVQLLKERLAPESATIHDALDQSSLSQFVSAFFGIVEPLVEMLHDILELFKRAQANSGPEHWRLRFDNYEIDLDHFKQCINEISKVSGYVEHPALDWKQGWKLFEELRKDNDGMVALQGVFNGVFSAVSDSIKPWVSAYENRYLPLPAELEPARNAPEWMHAFWGCLRRAVAKLHAADITGNGAAKALAKEWHYRKTESDAFALDSICQSEADSWLRTLVVMYASVRYQPELQIQLSPSINSFFAGIPSARHFIEYDVHALIEFFDLPIWQRRYEFYAAWIATRLITACEGHAVKVCHEDGVISLPFRETQLAHITTALPERFLFAERRTELKSPRSKHRVGGVQPDYSFWRLAAPLKCDLVVEVKHYKRAAVASWVEVFADYAAAHPDAKVVIVNYGPEGSALAKVDTDIADRCFLIGDLKPGSNVALERLKALVHEAVGKPRRRDSDGQMIEGVAVLLDVSSSMKINRETARRLLTDLVNQFAADSIAVANTALVGRWRVSEGALEKAVEAGMSGSTELNGPIETLLQSFERVIVVTDEDGRSSMDLDRFMCRDLLDHCERNQQVLEVALR